MARTNLSLGNLYRATQGSARTSQAVSLNAMNASAGTQAAFTSFAVDSITRNLPTFTYIVESTTEAATFSFGTQGSLHGTRVGSVAANYSVTFDNANFSSIQDFLVSENEFIEAQNNLSPELKEALKIASMITRPGELVLFSTASDNGEKNAGKEFNRAVRALKNK